MRIPLSRPGDKWSQVLHPLDIREQIALKMLQGKTDLVRAADDTQIEIILDAFRFADNFLAAAAGVREAEREAAEPEDGGSK